VELRFPAARLIAQTGRQAGQQTAQRPGLCRIGAEIRA
jgi:hypothetical protein